MLNPKDVFDFQVAQRTENLTDPMPCFETSWQVRADVPYLRGHFPEQPLLPAVAVVDGSLEMLRKALHMADLEPQSVFNAKFSAPITPGMVIKILLQQLTESQWRVDWTTLSPQGETLLLARVGLLI